MNTKRAYTYRASYMFWLAIFKTGNWKNIANFAINAINRTDGMTAFSQLALYVAVGFLKLNSYLLLFFTIYDIILPGCHINAVLVGRFNWV